MQRAEHQRAPAKTWPNARSSGATLASSRSSRGAQLDVRINASRDTASQMQLMEAIRGGPRLVAQRQMIECINTSPRMVTQRAQFEGSLGIAQRVKEEDPLQRKSTFPSPTEMDKLPPRNAHDTGLPDPLKSGVESLSGMSLGRVKVHYNSSEPAQINAFAYARGSDIHVAPGQEKHLPHEAWHVVQQMQGRVQATMQAKGIGINDDPGLEQEATIMGDRALRMEGFPPPDNAPKHAASPAVAQRARYIKCIQDSGAMAGEITRLTAASPLDAQPGTFGGQNEYGQAIEMNKWLSGGAGISTTHYNPGQMQYYSPVGFVVDVQPANVLGHFAGDGNTSLLHQGRPQYWRAFETIRTAMLADVVIGPEITAQGYAGNFAAAVTNLATATTLKGRIEAFLADAAVAQGAKTAAIALIKSTAAASLRDHYQNNGFNFPLGSGGPQVLAQLEGHLQGLAPGASYHHPQQNRDIKYTESQVHAELGHVVASFYTEEAGDYPDVIAADWRPATPAFLNNREQAARTVQQQLVTAGNAAVELYHLAGGQLAAGALPVPVVAAQVVPVPLVAPNPAPNPGGGGPEPDGAGA